MQPTGDGHRQGLGRGMSSHLPEYLARAAATLLFWLALVLWGSAIVNFFPAASVVAVSVYRVLGSALAPFAMVWAFWANTWGLVLALGAGLVLGGGLVLALQP